MPELWTENIRLTKFVESEGRELLPALEENLLGQLTKTAGEAYSGISSWRRWMRPNASPAITLLLLTKVQHVASPSQVKVASASPPDSSHTFSVLSEDAETTSRPSRLTATPRDCFRVAFQGAQFAPAGQFPHLQRLVRGSGNRQLPVGAHRHAPYSDQRGR